MKKIASVFLFFVSFLSCSDDISVPNPGFQAYRDNVLFRGIDIKAYKSTSGAIRIVALAQDEEIELRTTSDAIGTYYLGSISDNTADYNSSFDDVNIFYSSSTASGPILNIANLVLTGGTNYTAANSVTTTSVRSNNMPGGTGMRVNTTVNETGEVTAVKITSPGSGYKIGDIMTISGGDNNAKFKILSEIVITDNSNNTISGSFKFNARRFGTDELVNFQYGAFYKIPIVPEL